MSFPMAERTFTVTRPGQTTVISGNTVVAPDLTVATGVSILITSKQAFGDVMKVGILNQGVYLGSTFKHQDIKMGDVLLDEDENDSEGNPLKYVVDDVNRNMIFLKLFLRKLQLASG